MAVLDARPRPFHLGSLRRIQGAIELIGARLCVETDDVVQIGGVAVFDLALARDPLAANEILFPIQDLPPRPYPTRPLFC